MTAPKSVNAGIKVLRILLVLLAMAGIGVWAFQTFGPEPNPADGGLSGANAPSAPEPEHLVLVTYFSDDTRCATCLKIENQSREAIESGFPEQVASGLVRFQVVNFDRPENKHFTEEYEIVFKTVVISDRRQGEEAAWARFDDVWDLVDDRESFADYLQKGVRAYLKDDTDA